MKKIITAAVILALLAACNNTSESKAGSADTNSIDRLIDSANAEMDKMVDSASREMQHMADSAKDAMDKMVDSVTRK